MRVWNWIKTHKAWTSVIVVLVWSFIDIGDVSIGLVYGFFVGVIKFALYWRKHRTGITKEVDNAE